jgi:hypothetical protein
MEYMRRIAFETVLRACGFGALAIFCVMIGMSFHPKLAFQAGGFLTMIMAFILIMKSREALTKDYRRTEMWLYVEKDFRPPEAYAQWASATVLRDTYLTFALWTSLISIVMWAIALIFMLLGTESIYSFERDNPQAAGFLQKPQTSSAQPANRRPPPPPISYQFRGLPPVP